MDTKPIFDYLNEFSNPSLKCSPNERLVNPMDITQYLNWVESLRVAFVADVLSCENSSIKSMYLDELKQAISKVQQRGYCNMKDENITAAIVAGVTEMELVHQVVIVDRGLLASAEKAIEVLSPAKAVLASDTGEESKPVIVENTTKKEKTDSSYLDGHQVAKMFGIAYNNVKDKKWRDKHGFPYLQPTGDGGRVVFVKEDVEEWVKDNGNRG